MRRRRNDVTVELRKVRMADAVAGVVVGYVQHLNALQYACILAVLLQAKKEDHLLKRRNIEPLEAQPLVEANQKTVSTPTALQTDTVCIETG